MIVALVYWVLMVGPDVVGMYDTEAKCRVHQFQVEQSASRPRGVACLERRILDEAHHAGTLG